MSNQTEELTLSQRFDRIEGWFPEDQRSFGKIPEVERLHSSDVLCGYLKLASLMRDPSQFTVHGEHDEVYLCSPDELKDRLTDQDIVYLIRCGISIREDYFHRFAGG